MCQLIEDMLTEADRAGFTPRAIRLGVRQMELFEQWAAQYTIGSAQRSQSAVSQYNGMPIEPNARKSYRALVAADGTELTLP